VTAQERDAAIVQLFPLVKTIARAVGRRARWVEFDDLVGYGAVGLIAAVDGFDCGRGLTLERYARRKILYAMLDAVRREDHISQVARRVLAYAERDRFEIALQIGRMPSPLEIERRHPKLRSAQTMAHRRRRLSLDTGAAVEGLLAPDWSGDPAAVLCARETERSISIAIDRLPPRHRELLGMYYQHGFRLADLAERLSLTTQRVAQLRDVALASVREKVRAS
jgi:RNA polymerase sigma factor for flagellar operon FliA